MLVGVIKNEIFYFYIKIYGGFVHIYKFVNFIERIVTSFYISIDCYKLLKNMEDLIFKMEENRQKILSLYEI